MAELLAEAEECKNKGNQYFKENKLEEALEWYTKAIEVKPTATYYSNRAFVNIKLENYGDALEDANHAIELDSNFAKAYYRRGCTYLALTKLKEALQDFKQVLKIIPSDAVAQSKAKFVQKEIRRIEFERAIETERSKRPSELVKWKEIVVEESYDGMRLDIDPNSNELPIIPYEFAKDVLLRFKNEKKVHRKYAMILILKMIQEFSKTKSLYRVEVPKNRHINVCGDTHGQFFDFYNIFQLHGLPSSENPFLFNGDFVDRGSWGVEIVLSLYAFKAANPECIFMNRGNHESLHLNRVYGFEGEVKAKYNEDVFELFIESFNWLPLAAVLNNRVLVVHGGLFSKDGVTLADIEKIDRNRDIPESGLMCDILWSDPQKAKGRHPNKRGTSIQFGPDVTKTFLDANNLDLVVRSHEVKHEGYEVDHDGRLITIFSAPNYVDQVGNVGAVIIFKNENENGAFTTEFRQFKEVPHPNVKPMAYSNQLYNFS